MSTENITISDLEIMSNANNYRRWMFNQISPFIGQRILEVGSGIGNFTELLLDRELVIATDTYKPCVDYMKTRLGERLKAAPMHIDISNLEDQVDQKLIEYGFDTVICLNVLEHIKDDVRALSNMFQVLKPGGRLILLVPAFQFLYGTVDLSLDHFRRYTRKNLLPRMNEAGFEIEKTFYMNVIGMFGWFLNNRVLKKREESKDQIQVFDKYIAPLAERFETVVRPPVGLSLIAIGLKK